MPAVIRAGGAGHGTAHPVAGMVYLSSLANMVDVSAKIFVISLMATVAGKLNVEVVPCDETGSEVCPCPCLCLCLCVYVCV